MTLSSLALFGFTMMANTKANILDEPTVFGEPSALASDLAYSRRVAYGGLVCAGVLYTSVYGISMAGMIIAIAFGRITTIATQVNVVTSCHGHTALHTAIQNNTQKCAAPRCAGGRKGRGGEGDSHSVTRP